MKLNNPSSTIYVVLCSIVLLVCIIAVKSSEPCNVCVEVAFDLTGWRVAYNTSTVKRFWMSLFADIELKLQILMPYVDVKIEFWDTISINDINGTLPNPKTDEVEYMRAIANASNFKSSPQCVNILFIESEVIRRTFSHSDKRLVSLQTSFGKRGRGFRIDLEEDIFNNLGYRIYDFYIPNQFDAFPMEVWKYEENDVCSRSEDFPQQLLPNILYTSAAEQCSFWHSGSISETRDVCKMRECLVNNSKVPVYPSYNLPCGENKICVQGRCVPAGVKLTLISTALCVESAGIKNSTKVTAEICMRGTFQAQTFLLEPTNDVGFYVQTRTFDKNFKEQCLMTDTDRIVVKDCSNKSAIFVWKFLYSVNETGYRLYNIASKSFASVRRDGSLVMSPHCNLTNHSQRWVIYQVEGNKLLDSSKIDPRNELQWMFDKEADICQDSFKPEQTGLFSNAHIVVMTVEKDDVNDQLLSFHDSDVNSTVQGGLKLLSFNVLGSIAIAALSLSLAITAVLWRRYKQKTVSIIQHLTEQFYLGDIENIDKSKWLNEQLECIPFSKEWEFPIDNIQIGKRLGSGAFGTVMKGSAKGILHENEFSDIAIKTCRSRGKRDQFDALASELKILAYLGSHINLVQLLGVSANGQNLLVLLEFCPNGSLKEFLVTNGDLYETDGSNSYNNTREFLGYTVIHEPAKSVVTDSYIIRQRDLHRWAAEIAAGMEYIVEKRVLHGDLAARNVLLGEGLIAKICDFGMSQNLLKSYNYKFNKSPVGPLLPFKWMAIESIKIGVFSSESDVWSYGVLLWEIFSLGTVPYAGLVMDTNLIDRIDNGLRLEKPLNSPNAVYNIMMECWSKDPNSRPTFSDLRNCFMEMSTSDPVCGENIPRFIVLTGCTEGTTDSVGSEVMV